MLTSPYDGAAEFDATQPFRIERTPEPVLLPHPVMTRRVNTLAREFGAELVVIDPAVPLGLIGPTLDLPYDVVLHGAEVTVPGRLPASKQALAWVLRQGSHVIPIPGTRRIRYLEQNLAAATIALSCGQIEPLWYDIGL